MSIGNEPINFKNVIAVLSSKTCRWHWVPLQKLDFNHFFLFTISLCSLWQFFLGHVLRSASSSHSVKKKRFLHVIWIFSQIRNFRQSYFLFYFVCLGNIWVLLIQLKICPYCAMVSGWNLFIVNKWHITLNDSRQVRPSQKYLNT